MDRKHVGKIDGWLDGQEKNRRIVREIEKQMAGWIETIDGWLDGQEKIEGWLDVYKNGWMDRKDR